MNYWISTARRRRAGGAWACLGASVLLPAALVCLTRGGATLAAEPSTTENCEPRPSVPADGDPAESVRTLEEAVKKTPDDLDCRLLLAQAYERNGEPRQAEAQLAEIIRRQPRHRQAAVALAHRAFQHNEFNRVVGLLEPLRRRGDDLETCRMLSIALYHEGKLDQARRTLTTIVEREAATAADHELLGDIAISQKRFAIAAEEYTESLRRSVDRAAVHLKLARAYLGLGNHLGETAMRQIQGGEPDALLADGYILDRIEDKPDVFAVCPSESAIFHTRKAIALGADLTEAHLLLGDVWLGARRWKRAEAEYQRIEGQVPDAGLAGYFCSYAQALWGVGDAEGSVLRMEQAAKLDQEMYGPRLDRVYVDVAEWYSQEGNLPKYIEYMRRAVARTPESSELRYRLGNALWEHGRRDEAVLQWRITLELRPDHPDRDRLLELIRAAG